MIWVGGEFRAGESLAVSALDRAFEHGLGLFETFRTWNGKPVLWPRHRERLIRSARELNLALDLDRLPTERSIQELVQASGLSGEDARVRLTLSGGSPDGSPGLVWMKASALPPLLGAPGATVRASWHIAASNPLAGFKTLNHWDHRIALERAHAAGFDEALSITDEGMVYEGTRTNLFALFAGQIHTAPVGPEIPCLPGVMREVLIEQAARAGREVWSAEPLTLDQLHGADEVFLTNAVRGVVPVLQLGPHGVDHPLGVRVLPAPGSLTVRLWNQTRLWLEAGGD